MNILQFIRYINKRKGWRIQGSYYAVIDQWRQWWQGNYPGFHDIRSLGADGQVHIRPMYRLRMPKQVCEDWASLLLNDKTTVSIADRTAARWLLGDVGSQQTGGLLGQWDFWRNANRLVELAFRSGTGAFVLTCEGLRVQSGQILQTPEARLWLDYLPAECILPVTVRHGRVTDCAFASEVTVGGRSCIYLQTHRLTARGYEITNEYFTSEDEDSDQAAYFPAPLPEGLLPSFCTGSDVPWFSLFSPAQVKNHTEGPGLGMAVFAEALDQARQCDLAFDNYCRDLFLGGKKVFYNRELLRTITGSDGCLHLAAPDELRQELFVQTGGDPDRDDWHEYNPDLRVEANSRAVQDALDYFSFKTGLGTHHYQFSGSAVATATQYIGDRQDMIQHANRHQIQIEGALLSLFGTLLWMGKTILGMDIDPESELSIHFDDSYISASETRRQQDKDDALSGFWPRYRYNMEWRGMSEEEAKRAVQEARDESSGGTGFLQFDA